MGERSNSEGENIQPGDMNFFLLRYMQAAPELQSKSAARNERNAVFNDGIANFGA